MGRALIFDHGHEQALSAHLVALRPGTGAIADTLREMVRIRDESKLDPRLRSRVATLFLLLPDRDELAEVATLFQYVRDRVRYLRDIAGVETVATPECTLTMRAGDCDDKSLALATMLEVAGYPTKFVAIGTTAPDWFEHVYVKAQLSDGTWVALDATEQVPPGWEPGNVTAVMERG